MIAPEPNNACGTIAAALPWVQAIGVLVVGIVGAFIALQQVLLARIRLQHDLYDRRYKVYDAVRALLNEATSKGAISGEQYTKFATGTADAIFLFDETMASYVRNIREHVATMLTTEIVLPDMPVGPERKKYVDAKYNALLALIAELDKVTEKFRPYLTLGPHTLKKRPLRRWIVRHLQRSKK